MMEYRWEQSLSPGNEQLFYWGSAAADQQGSRNYMGVKSPAVDAMIAAMLAATSRTDFVAATRALDRVLLTGFYVVRSISHLYKGGALDTNRASSHTSLFGYLPERGGKGSKALRLLPMILGETPTAASYGCDHSTTFFGAPGWAILIARCACATPEPTELHRWNSRAPEFRSSRSRNFRDRSEDCAVWDYRPRARWRYSCRTIVESIVAFLGVLRAGMIALPLPLLWRQEEIVSALRQVGVKAIFGCSRFGQTDQIEIAMQSAVELFRSVTSAASDRICRTHRSARRHISPRRRRGNRKRSTPWPCRSARRSITFYPDASGLAPICAQHVELVAGGLETFLRRAELD
jgi:hypothetical protein